MDLAIESSKTSLDPSTKVGACLTSPFNKLIFTGCNHMPKQLDETKPYPWERKDNNLLNTKYPYVIHAEMDTITKAIKLGFNEFNDAILYVTLYPCNECAKLIVSTGIKQLFYKDNKYEHTDSTKASKRILESAGVIVKQIL